MKKLIALAVILSGVISFDGFAARVAGTSRRPGAVASAPVSGVPVNNNAEVKQRGVERSATQQPSKNSGANKVVARAATTQKAISSGTKIAGQTANTVIDEECKTKYYGCMDSFCMLDNANGGRCLCSNRHAELDNILEQIQKLDEQSYAMATTGVERINMGEDADKVEAMVNNASNQQTNQNTARSLNIGALDLNLFQDDDIFNIGDNADDISTLSGDELYNAVYKMCVGQIPECSANMPMLKTLYAQQIRSDCMAYENSLKQQKNASAKKLQTAQTAMKEAALEQYRNANKYDLGQCTVRFKQCMQTTADCGEDFSKCAMTVASNNAQTKVGKKNKTQTYSIKGDFTEITIGAATYDTLLAKKPMCESVTKQCVDVRDKVWDAFLREAAPALKSAELIAESNLRTSCIGNISECFQKACKDNLDPKDPDGSYDMCLSRPDTVRSLCKVEIEPCEATEPKIMDYVYARLASMRVDSCTTEVKSCLQSEDRCGKDYSNCIGLDTDTIIKMCPYEKLTGCQYVYGEQNITGEDVYDNIATMIEGIMLNIDNGMLQECQNALNESMIRVCGDAEDCENFALDKGVGTRSFKYQVCAYNTISAVDIGWTGECYDSLDAIPLTELENPTKNNAKGWAGKLSGVVYWGDIEYKKDAQGEYKFTTAQEYIQKLKDAGHKVDRDTKETLEDLVFDKEIRQLENSVERVISAIEADEKVRYCMTGRAVQGMRGQKIGTRNGVEKDKVARFPHLTDSIREKIAATALKKARENYDAQYDKELARMMDDQVKAAQKIDKEHATDIAFESCKAWAESSALPHTPTPKASNVGKWVAVGVLVAAAVVATVFTFAGSSPALISIFTASKTLVEFGSVSATMAMAAAAGAAGVAVGVDDTIAKAGGGNTNIEAGHSSTEQWNYKEVVTTVFNRVSGKCTKVTVSQQCKKTKKNICKEWADSTQTEKTIDLL